MSARTLARPQQFQEHITASFVVGRAPLSHEPADPLAADLLLCDLEPIRLSRGHFAIVQTTGPVRARLPEQSRHHSQRRSDRLAFRGGEAPLQAGDIEIVAGGAGSPFLQGRSE